jgi:hypothetical protein
MFLLLLFHLHFLQKTIFLTLFAGFVALALCLFNLKVSTISNVIHFAKLVYYVFLCLDALRIACPCSSYNMICLVSKVFSCQTASMGD